MVKFIASATLLGRLAVDTKQRLAIAQVLLVEKDEDRIAGLMRLRSSLRAPKAFIGRLSCAEDRRHRSLHGREQIAMVPSLGE